MMCSVIVNDLLDELLSENNRLLNDLMFANDLIDCLQRLRNCLIDFNSNCDCVQNCDNKTYFQLLDNKYKQLVDNRHNKVEDLRTYCLDQLFNRSLTRVNVKDEPQDPISSSVKSVKRSAEEVVGSDGRQKKRKSVTFDETHNVINEYRTESPIESRPDHWDQSLVVKSDKMSTNLTNQEISEMIANDECIARLDSINDFIKS